jgi:ATP synthase F1 delta subunit
MPDPGLAKRYASALFAAAVKRDLVDATEADFASVAALIEEDRSLRAFLHSPEVLTEHKVEMLRKVFSERVQPLVYQFLLLLLDKKRFPLVGEIAPALSALADEHRGVVRARVFTAIDLKPELEERLRKALESKTSKQVVLDCETRPELIGGVAVVVGDRLLDGSVSRALDRLREELAHASVI